MLPLLALATPAIPAVLKAITVAVGTAVVTTVAVRATNDAYDAAMKKEPDNDKD